MSTKLNDRLKKETINFYLNFIAKEIRGATITSYDHEDIKIIRSYFDQLDTIQKNELIYQLLNTNSENIIKWYSIFFKQKTSNILEVSSLFYSQKVSKQFDDDECFSIIDVMLDNSKLNQNAINIILDNIIWNEDLVNYTINQHLAYKNDNTIDYIFQYLSNKNYLTMLKKETLKLFIDDYIEIKSDNHETELCLDLLFKHQLNIEPFKSLDENIRQLILHDENYIIDKIINSISHKQSRSFEVIKVENITIFNCLKDKVSESIFRERFFNLTNNENAFSYTFNQMLNTSSYVEVKKLGTLISYFHYYNKIAKQLNFQEVKLDLNKPINEINSYEEQIALLEKLKMVIVLSNSESKFKTKEKLKI